MIKLPIDPTAEPLFNIPPYKRIDHLRPKTLKKILKSSADVEEATANGIFSKYKYNPMLDQFELIE